MFRLLLIFALFTSAYALNCYTCDSFLTCSQPQQEFCPSPTQCYTLRKNGQVTYKGCTAACSTLPANNEPGVQCTTCSTNNCNTGSHVVTRLDVNSDQWNNGNHFLGKKQNRRSIGHGAGIQQSQIGHGVSGNDVGYSAYGNNGGIGSGVGHNNNHQNHKIGHGVQAGHGIGGGAAPNKHHHRQRRSGGGVGIGQGVRPKSAVTSLPFISFALVIANLFQ